MLWIRIIAAVLVALVLGFFGLSLVFSDLGPGESNLSRNIVTALAFVVGGFITGLIAGSRAWWLCLLSAWGPILLGIFAPRAFLLLNVGPPVLLSLIGGFSSVLAGRFVSNRRKPRPGGGGQSVGSPSAALKT